MRDEVDDFCGKNNLNNFDEEEEAIGKQCLVTWEATKAFLTPPLMGSQFFWTVTMLAINTTNVTKTQGSFVLSKGLSAVLCYPQVNTHFGL